MDPSRSVWHLTDHVVALVLKSHRLTKYKGTAKYAVRTRWYSPYGLPYGFRSEIFLSMKSSSQNSIMGNFSKGGGTSNGTAYVAFLEDDFAEKF